MSKTAIYLSPVCGVWGLIVGVVVLFQSVTLLVVDHSLSLRTFGWVFLWLLMAYALIAHYNLLPYYWKKPWIILSSTGITLHSLEGFPLRKVTTYHKQWNQLVNVELYGSRRKYLIFTFKNPEQKITVFRFLTVSLKKVLSLTKEYWRKYA